MPAADIDAFEESGVAELAGCRTNTFEIYVSQELFMAHVLYVLLSIVQIV